MIYVTIFESLKKQRTCKPGSVPPCGSVCHLSRPSVTCRLERPTPRHRAGSPTYAGVHGLATHEMYGPPVSPSERWALTPPFHPYLFAQAVIFCYMVFALADNFPLGSMVPCVARTFLFTKSKATNRNADNFCAKIVFCR